MGDNGTMSTTSLPPRVSPSPEPMPADAQAPTYDLSYRDVFWASRGYEDRCDRLALRALLHGAGGHLLDLGAGFGRLADEYHAFDAVTLVDASPAMIEAARERVGSDPRFTVIAADAAHLPIRDGSVDVVVAVRLLVHLSDPSEVFREIARVLRPGGRLIIEFANRRHILAAARYLAGRQSWSPAGRRSHEYFAAHFAHQPATVEAQLRAAGLEPYARRTVSLFRSAWLKRVFPANLLAGIEAPLQRPLGPLAPGPAMYIGSIRSDAGTVASGGAPGRAREDDSSGS